MVIVRTGFNDPNPVAATFIVKSKSNLNIHTAKLFFGK